MPGADACCDASEAEFFAEVPFWDADLEAVVAVLWAEVWVVRAEEPLALRRDFECLDGLLITVDCSAATGR